MQMNYCVIRRVDLWRGLYNVVNHLWKERIPVAIAIQSGNFNIVIGSNLTLIATSKKSEKVREGYLFQKLSCST